jgi:hypothetical protein
VRAVTDAEVSDALHEHAVQIGSAWSFESGFLLQTTEHAMQIVRICLMLDVPVSDTIASEITLKLVNEVADLERRLSAIEAAS